MKTRKRFEEIFCNPLGTWYVSFCVELFAAPHCEDGGVRKGSPWLIFILFPFDGLFFYLFVDDIPCQLSSRRYRIPTKGKGERKQESALESEDINNGEIISIFLFGRNVYSEKKAHTTCEYESTGRKGERAFFPTLNCSELCWNIYF